MKYSITRALSELNKIDEKIRKAIDRANFIAGAKKSSKKINNIYTREDFNKLVLGDYQKINDLIKRRDLIKDAIVESNAVTKVTVNGIEMSVAKAIERKTSIEYEELLLEEMKMQYKSILAQVSKENDKMETKLQQLLEASFGKEGKTKTSSDEIDAIAIPFKAQNEYEIINPLALQDKIKELEDNILGFKNEIDFVLSESNSLTTVEIPE